MSLEITGRIIQIAPTQHVNDRFKKREFVLEITEEIIGNTYTNYAKMQTVQAKCDLLDRFSVGESVTAHFNIKGNRWERDGKVDYITNLDCWKLQSTAANTPQQPYATDANSVGMVTNAQPVAPIASTGGEAAHDLPF